MIARKEKVIGFVLLGLVLIYLLETGLIVLQKRASNLVSNLVILKIRLSIWKKILFLPYFEYETYTTGDLKNFLDTDMEPFEKFIEVQIVDCVFAFLTSVVLATLMLLINWKLSLLGLVTVPISFLVTNWLGKGLQRASEKRRKIMGGYERWFLETVQGWKEIKALKLERLKLREFTRYWKILCREFFKIQMFTFGNRCFNDFKDFFLIRMNLYFLGGLLVLNEGLSIGNLLLFMQYFTLMLTNLNKLIDNDVQFSTQLPSIDRVMGFLMKESHKITGSKVKIPLKGEIVFEKIVFSYPQMKQKMELIFDLIINKNQTTAIIGRSGSGKSTFLKILTGLYYPQKGRFFFDGIDATNLDQRFLRSQMGIVMQDVVLFNLTLKENLLLANAKASIDEIINACTLAQINDYIQSLPDGYDTVIGEKGVSLSGGQRQRIAIARALLKKPAILILDEATSALDGEAEEKFQNVLKDLGKRLTVIVVAHRYSSIRIADRLIVLEEGRVVASGSHAELQGENKIYDLLFGDFQQN